ncbi:SWI/SNF-related matrix-associated actin-dependent regulator of chromatin subfamily A-like protein 1 [Chrysoperla carnea]|uniref:SWI/SNF-related matrix-associated actin-dependent regulator of chromatin subfamily A-like protein 1 n=1 Tax=Chrysoperla carnea TaxID=189513 RepID=UPI001D0956F2|nr:SWI/SNF-related matrix-associated actin-dependent regulator of chromatin subfamily A-like protein 1 [Chrysoperla carnea]
MLCSPEQIEAKRRKALEKLQAKKALSASTSSSNTASFPTAANLQNNKPATAISTAPKTFYPKTVLSPTTSFQNNEYQNRSVVTKVLFNKDISKESNSNGRTSSYSPYAKNNQKQMNNTPEMQKKSAFSTLMKNPLLGNIALVTERRFVLKTDKYSEVVHNICKKMSTKRWEPSTKLWTFDITEYDVLTNQLKLLRPDVVIDTIPQCVVNLIKNNVKQQEQNSSKQIDLSSIDPELLNSLMKFQLDGVQFGIHKRGRCLIADEMGLGKTFQALAIACYYRNDWPMLIVTTSSTRNSWQETIQTYMPSVPLYYVTYMSTSKDFINEAKILIITHDLMARTIDKLLTKEFRTLIIDESHTIKNFKTKCTKAAYRLAKQAKRVILLSGTPALSRPSELFTQIQLIDDTFFKDFKEYSLRYCAGHETKFGWDASGQSNLQELEIILNIKFMIRRTKEQVLPHLPNKTRELIMLDQQLIDRSSTEDDKKCLNTLRNNFKQTSKNNSFDKQLLLTYFNHTSKLKQPAVCSYLVNELQKDINDNKKLLIFAHHQFMLDSICEVLSENGFHFVRIDGKTPTAQRAFFVNKFNTKDQCRCAVLSILATNAGITLTAASLVIFAELHWNPSILVQAEGRAHRIGQENNVLVRYLIAKNTADDDMWNMIKSKTSVLNAAGLSKDSFDDATEKKQETLSQNGKNKENMSQNKTLDEYFPQVATPLKNSNIANNSINKTSTITDEELFRLTTPSKSSNKIEDFDITDTDFLNLTTHLTNSNNIENSSINNISDADLLNLTTPLKNSNKNENNPVDNFTDSDLLDFINDEDDDILANVQI